MKLNQLTIHNIASIKDATIRFDAQPLSSSEVFLITGKTGAGKSTILDAICLALYADTPRLDSTNMQGNMADQEKVVKVDDPRQLMRRNTGEAFVQLTFKGANGVSYEATWSVARSRNKPDGNLQAKKWTLKNMLSDITYNKDEEIKAEIRKAIGLDFKQFCRTTMLAQGEFTRFLNSKDDDKADILEKITGASIYSRIGKRIFDMTKEHKEKWLQEEQKIEASKPMSDDEVAAKKAEIVRLDKEREANNTLVQQEQTKAAWLTKEQELAQKTTEAKTSLARIEQQIGGDEFRMDDLLLQLWQSTTEARGWAVDRRNYSGRFVVLPHARLPSLQPTRVNRSFTKYEAVYNVSMLGLSCAINCNSRNGERSCFFAVSMTECITAYASAPRNVRKSPATFCFVFAGLTARSLALLSYGTSGLSRKVKI